jgi:hypothetical protein
VGELVIEPGLTRVQARSAGPIRGALLDLREIRLTPKE